MANKGNDSLPINVVIGWNEGIARRKDAVAIAKGHISKRFIASDVSWYAIAPFLGGFIWEAQEGGDGKGYLQPVIDALTEDPSKEYWFPSGDRAFKVMMRDGKPVGILLSERESAEVFESGQPPLLPKSKMYPAERKGAAVMAMGTAMSGASAFYLMTSIAFYGFFANPGPSVVGADLAILPHAQWNLVDEVKVTEIVSKLEFRDKRWDAIMREHEVPGLQELVDTTESLIEKIKQDIQQMPEEAEDYSATSQEQVKNNPTEVGIEATEGEVLTPEEALQRKMQEYGAENNNSTESQSIIKTINTEENDNLQEMQNDGEVINEN